MKNRERAVPLKTSSLREGSSSVGSITQRKVCRNRRATCSIASTHAWHPSTSTATPSALQGWSQIAAGARRNRWLVLRKRRTGPDVGTAHTSKAQTATASRLVCTAYCTCVPIYSYSLRVDVDVTAAHGDVRRPSSVLFQCVEVTRAVRARRWWWWWSCSIGSVLVGRLCNVRCQCGFCVWYYEEPYVLLFDRLHEGTVPGHQRCVLAAGTNAQPLPRTRYLCSSGESSGGERIPELKGRNKWPPPMVTILLSRRQLILLVVPVENLVLAQVCLYWLFLI